MADEGVLAVAKAESRTRERRRNADRSAETRERILDATIRCLRHSGYNAVTNMRVADMAGVSCGALMHHFPNRQALLVATVEYGYARLRAHRQRQLDKFAPGLDRFRGLMDIAWETAQLPESLAMNEIRIGSRSDQELARAVTPIMSSVGDDYGRFLGRHVRAAGMVPDQEMRGLFATMAMALRSLAIDRFTYPSPEMVENVLSSLRAHREEIIARQLGAAASRQP